MIDYLPFGTDRVNVQLGGFDNKYAFTDQEKDSESGLMNFDARQYNQSVGRFLSQDPSSLKIALAGEVKNLIESYRSNNKIQLYGRSTKS